MGMVQVLLGYFIMDKPPVHGTARFPVAVEKRHESSVQDAEPSTEAACCPIRGGEPCSARLFKKLRDHSRLPRKRSDETTCDQSCSACSEQNIPTVFVFPQMKNGTLPSIKCSFFCCCKVSSFCAALYSGAISLPGALSNLTSKQRAV